MESCVIINYTIAWIEQTVDRPLDIHKKEKLVAAVTYWLRYETRKYPNAAQGPEMYRFIVKINLHPVYVVRTTLYKEQAFKRG